MAERFSGKQENTRLNNDAEELPELSVRVRRGSIDLPFLVLTILLLTIGVITVLSASFARGYYSGRVSAAYYFVRQARFAILGVAAMIGVSFIRPVTMRKWSMYLMLAAVLLLVLVPIIGVEENGAKRWLGFGGFTFQPSEIAKIAEIILFADLIARFKNKMQTFKYGVVPFAIIIALFTLLLALEKHLSCTLIMVAIGGIMMFVGGTQKRWFGILAGVAVVFVLVYVATHAYASNRFIGWLDPESDPLNEGFQVLQSLYAIGSGGLLGLGFGQSRQKYMYLPEEHNDYIFSIWCEEMGFIGAMLILVLFAMLILRGFWIALHASTRFDFLVAVGITSMLAIQVFLNVGVVSNFLPSTGISMPFFSYGGTALMIQLFEMGIILSISRDIPLKKAG